ncbi:MAG: hypothetical protein WC441_00645 [Patescibacteria group bacterium]
MNRKLLLLIILIVLSFIVFPAKAHRLRLVYSQDLNPDSPFLIAEPQIAQNFYGELKSSPDYYQINLAEPLNLHFSLLSPANREERQDFAAEIISNNYDSPELSLFSLASEDPLWDVYFEKFAGDKYYQGPEASVDLEPGSYFLKVYSPDNKGKYTLMLGQEESFSSQDIIDSLEKLPVLKKEFFAAPPIAAYFNLIGLFASLVIASAIVFAFWLASIFFRK